MLFKTLCVHKYIHNSSDSIKISVYKVHKKYEASRNDSLRNGLIFLFLCKGIPLIYSLPEDNDEYCTQVHNAYCKLYEGSANLYVENIV